MHSVQRYFSHGVPLAEWMRRLHISENAVLLVLAAIVGVTTGFGVYLFSSGIEFFTHIFREVLAGEILSHWLGVAGIVVALALGGLIVGLIMRTFIGFERHSGLAGIIEAVALAGGRLRYARMPFKALSSALSIGAGSSSGPEAPSVQIGANIGSMFAQWLHLSEDNVRLLVAAGSASAIGVIFQAPIAGVFFAIELVLHNEFTTGSFGVIVLSAVVSSAFTALFQTGGPELGIRNYTFGGLAELPLYLILGLLLAPMSALFIRAVIWQHDLWHKHVHLSRPLRTALAGVVIGVVAIFFPQIMGTGREFMNAVLNTGQAGQVEFTILFLIAVGFLKILMTAVSLAGGFVGGVFAPALFVGTMIGGAYGRILSLYLPHATASDPQAYAIAGMAAVMGGVIRAPITAIMLVFEITNDYHLILPIMLTTVVCVYVTERIQPDNIETIELARKGLRLQHGHDIDLMQGVAVREVMISPAPSILETANLNDLRVALRKFDLRSLAVVEPSGRLVGIVTLTDLQRAYEEGKTTDVTVADICTRNVVTVEPDDVLWTAIKAMGLHEYGRIPVVDRDTGDLVGMLARQSIVQAYNTAITQKTEHQHNAEQIRLNMLTGAHVFEMYVYPGSPADGKRIKEIRWPVEMVVASVRRHNKLIVPHGETDIRAGDTITIVGEPEVERTLRALLTNNEGINR